MVHSRSGVSKGSCSTEDIGQTWLSVASAPLMEMGATSEM